MGVEKFILIPYFVGCRHRGSPHGPDRPSPRACCGPNAAARLRWPSVPPSSLRSRSHAARAWQLHGGRHGCSAGASNGARARANFRTWARRSTTAAAPVSGNGATLHPDDVSAWPSPGSVMASLPHSVPEPTRRCLPGMPTSACAATTTRSASATCDGACPPSRPSFARCPTTHAGYCRRGDERQREHDQGIPR